MMLKSNEKQKQSHSPKMDILVQYSLIKWLIQGLWGCLFFFIIFIFILYFVSQVLCISTDYDDDFSMRDISFFFICNNFYLIIWRFGIASESKLEVLKDSRFHYHNCFYFFYSSFKLFYFIIIATSHIAGDNSYSEIWVGEDYKPSTGIGIPTHTRVCMEVNTHTGYFINDKHIKDRVVNVQKNVYFGVWYFICYSFLFFNNYQLLLL
jgi:hypothetical protein